MKDREKRVGDFVLYTPDRVSAYPVGAQDEAAGLALASASWGREPLPCQRTLEGEGGVVDELQPQTCGEPSVLFAMGNDAHYGHVCRACWEALEESERARYAEKRLVLLNAIYGKLGTRGRWDR